MISWSPGVTLADIERQVILKALQFYRNNKTATSIALGISIRTLDTRIELYAQEDMEQKINAGRRQTEREIQLARARGIHPHQYDTNDGPVDSVGNLATVSPTEKRAASHQTGEGLRMESLANAPAQSPVPVSQREEVQDLLPKQASSGGQRRKR